MTTVPTIAFLGAGTMAGALLRGAILRSGLPPERFAATDVRPEAAEALAKQLGIQAFASNVSAVQWAEVVVLAVKPQVLPAVLAEVAPQLRPDTLLISIVAGVPIARIAAVLGGGGRIIRAMPNMPVLVGAGATALVVGPHVTAADLEVALLLFRGVGLVVQLEEKLMDGVTGLSGSGPAYGFVAIEALADAGVREGLPREVAVRLAAQTLLGAAQLVLETGEHPAKLKDMVMSPAGTTAAGVAALERGGLRAALLAAVEASAARAKELGNG
jgi:pyrroline-5-carboxylate reductase